MVKELVSPSDIQSPIYIGELSYMILQSRQATGAFDKQKLVPYSPSS